MKLKVNFKIKANLDVAACLFNKLCPFCPELCFPFYAYMNNYVCVSFPERTPPEQTRYIQLSLLVGPAPPLQNSSLCSPINWASVIVTGGLLANCQRQQGLPNED